MTMRLTPRTILHALTIHTRRRARLYMPLGVIFVVFIATFFLLLLPPIGFPSNTFVTVEEDATFDETAQMLEERHVVHSAFLLKAMARIGRADREVQAGRYLFEEPVGLSTILYRLTHGISGIPTTRVTFPEGITAREMSETLQETLPEFNAIAFRSEAERSEGYLFPDTYLVPLDSTTHDIIERMRSRFDMIWEELLKEGLGIDATLSPEGKTRVVIMASILEREAKTEEDMKIVAGILWDRIEIGMALQVDAVFGYIKGIDTYHPSGEDLDIDSPYNTYMYPGLPPGPIGNPGEKALRAALTPTDTDYLYYLTGTDGTMHYAETFEEHKKNKELYLR